MSNFEYEIGKEIQALKDRVSQLEVLSKKTHIPPQRAETKVQCEAVDDQTFELCEEGEIVIEGEKVAYKTFTFGRYDSGDCEWRKESITVFSDGNYKDTFELKDHGTVFGDTFTTVLRLQDKKDGHTFAKWQWRRSLSAKEELHDEVNGYDYAIRRAFSSIKNCNRRRHCSG